MSLKDLVVDNFYNDMNSLPIYAFIFGIAILIMIAATFFHELGHLLYFRLNLKKKAKVVFKYTNIFNFYWAAGCDEDYVGITSKQNEGILACGILAGTIPIVLSMSFWNPFIMLLIPYIAGSWRDIKNMAELGEKIDKEKKE